MDIVENIALGPMTTLGVGGPARYLANIHSESDLLEGVNFSRSQALPVFVLGGGSNLLVGDAGFRGVVLRIQIAGALQFMEKDGEFAVRAPAGFDWDQFVFAICERGLSGVECLAGIPGSIGGSPVQNVGAYGQEVAETIVSVRALDLKVLEFVELPAADCGFGYRRSIFNSAEEGRYVVTSVLFRFLLGQEVKLRYAELQRHFEGRSPSPIEVYHAVRTIRHGKGMLLVKGEADCRSAGSFFKNPIVDKVTFNAIEEVATGTVPHWDAGSGKVKLAAAWLVEQAGFHKGFVKGRVGISSRHTLAVINRGEATADEIVALRDEIQSRVEQRFAVKLEQEPVLV